MHNISGFKEPRQARSKERVDRILRAARDLLIRDGVLDLKMNDVATLADIPIGSLYQYFPTKVVLIAKLFDRSLESNRELVTKHFEGIETPEQYSAAISNLIWDLHKKINVDPVAKQVVGRMMNVPEIAELHHLYHDFHADLFLETLKKVGTNIPEEKVFWRCRVVFELWLSVTTMAISLPKKEARSMIKEAIDIGLRELELPPV